MASIQNNVHVHVHVQRLELSFVQTERELYKQITATEFYLLIIVVPPANAALVPV